MVFKSDIGKRKKAIVIWYKKVTEGASDQKKLVLLNKWVRMCEEEEQYAIASVLKKEMDILLYEGTSKSKFITIQVRLEKIKELWGKFKTILKKKV